MTLPYALAKELKDKGWPQPYFDLDEYRPAYRGEFIWEREPTKNTSGEGAYSPSLSELIEGCPRYYRDAQFTLRALIIDEWEARYDWREPGESLLTDKFLSQRSHTPEEAVARLWLKLQKDRAGPCP